MSLQDELDRLSKPGVLFEDLADGSVQCQACGHQCLIKPGQRGVCKIRFNQEGTLQVPWGYVSSLQVDPVEKKPFGVMFHHSRLILSKKNLFIISWPVQMP
jgi:pyruvate formate lyase activating enzyme